MSVCWHLCTGHWQGTQKAAIVASSAAGWISRIFLADGPPYSNTVYYGADRVHTLVTLGTPHTSAEAVTRRNIDYVNNSYPGAHMPGVR
jgi:triacylglycerol esterase/lipase EstA (alpha/beta hydrolase family)